MLSSQLAIFNPNVELLGEALYRQCGEIVGVRVDEGEVVIGLIEVAPAAQRQSSVLSSARRQRRREARLREGETNAHVPATVVSVGRVDADVDGSVGIGEGTNPPRTLGMPSSSTSMVSIRLRTPHSASPWFIGTFA